MLKVVVPFGVKPLNTTCVYSPCEPPVLKELVLVHDAPLHTTLSAFQEKLVCVVLPKSAQLSLLAVE